jgi:ketosteroid isomerase-like protein
MLSTNAVIEHIHDTWIGHERANAPTQVLALCSERVRWIPPDGPEISGKTAITEWLLQNPITILQLETSKRDIWVTGRLASLRASFQTHGVDIAGTPQMSEGRHQWVLEAEPDGQWRVLLVSWVIGPDGASGHPR